MATQNQRIYNDDYRIAIYQGDFKQINISVYSNFYRTDEINLSGYTAYIKTSKFEKTGTIYGDDNNKIQFLLTSTETNITPNNYPYEIYITNGTRKETIVQDYLEIINII